MEEQLVIGIGKVTLHLRQAQSLKDKRQVVKSLVQKLRNLGFSVTEVGYSDLPKQACIGFGYVGAASQVVSKAMQDADKVFREGFGFEILRRVTDTLDYSGDETGEIPIPEPEEG